MQHSIVMNSSCGDGRVCSSLDEHTIISSLRDRFGDRLYVPNARMWYDIMLHDVAFGWIPINIKTTTMKTSDNVGNLAICLYSYTNYTMDKYKPYNNGKIYKLLVDSIRKNKYGIPFHRDYYFLVVNKQNVEDIVINSIRGLQKIMPNCNNLPFQVRWLDNKQYIQRPLCDSIAQFIECINKTKTSWQTQFIHDMQIQ
jgi:hypothetical protein